MLAPNPAAAPLDFRVGIRIVAASAI